MKNRDIIYRIAVLSASTSLTSSASYWYRPWASLAGECGARLTLQEAKDSARSAGLKEGTYEIWKIHAGVPSSGSPYFVPESVV